MAITPYREWLRGRTPSPALLRQWQQAMKIHSSPFPPVGAGSGRPPVGSGTPSAVSPSGSSITPYRTWLRGRTPSNTLLRQWRQEMRIFDSPLPPVRSGSSSSTPSVGSGSSGRSSTGDPFTELRGGSGSSSGRGGDPFAEIRDTSAGARPSPSGTRPSPGGPIPDTPPASTPSPRPPSGTGERLVKGKTFAERVAANAAKRGAPPPSKIAQLGKAVGKVARPVMSVMNSPAGKMAGRVGVAYYGGKTAGDLFGLAEPYIDMARYGHKLPYKDGVGGRDNRLNDVLGNIPFNVREAMSPGQTQRDLSKLTGGVSDKVFKTLFPYRERPTPTAATQKPNQAPKKPEGVGKPIGAAPKQPDSLRGIGEQARGQSKALRSPDDYLGSAFDATLRKGIDTGRNYLRSQMNKDGLDSDQQSKIMARFNDKIAGDKELSKAANKGGIVNTIEAKDPGRGQRTLEAYRGQRGAYKGNTSYKDMQEKYVK